MATTKKTDNAQSKTEELHKLTQEYFSKVGDSIAHHPVVESVVHDADENTLLLARQIGVSVVAGLGVFALQRYIESPKDKKNKEADND